MLTPGKSLSSFKRTALVLQKPVWPSVHYKLLVTGLEVLW